jgi:hypothetical protein
MSASRTVHRLLFQALLEIRNRGYSTGDKAVYHLADLFHNVALQLEAVVEGNSNITYDDVLIFIRQRAREEGWEKWIDDRISEIAIRNGEKAPVG